MRPIAWSAIPILAALVGCTELPHPDPATAQPQPQPERPPPTHISAAPTASHITVATNTTDPEKVRVGVREWLEQRPRYKPHLINAILHRMQVESGFAPCITSNDVHGRVRPARYHHEGSYKYLLQWSGPRLPRLWHMAHVSPGQCPPWIEQVSYMDWEIDQEQRWHEFFEKRDTRQAYNWFSEVYLGGRI